MEADDKFAHPKHPERICWGCDNYCRAGDLLCEIRVLHPVELFGEDWWEWSRTRATESGSDLLEHP